MGITDNEIADKLAKQGAEEQPSYEIQVPIRDARSLFKKEAGKERKGSLKHKQSIKENSTSKIFIKEKRKSYGFTIWIQRNDLSVS